MYMSLEHTPCYFIIVDLQNPLVLIYHAPNSCRQVLVFCWILFCKNWLKMWVYIGSIKWGESFCVPVPVMSHKNCKKGFYYFILILDVVTCITVINI